MSHPQPDGQTLQARVLPCGLVREELGSRPNSRCGRIVQQRRRPSQCGLEDRELLAQSQVLKDDLVSSPKDCGG